VVLKILDENDEMIFGKWKGHCLWDIFQNDPDYLVWVMEKFRKVNLTFCIRVSRLLEKMKYRRSKVYALKNYKESLRKYKKKDKSEKIISVKTRTKTRRVILGNKREVF